MRLLYASVCAGTILILSSLFFGCSPVVVLEAQSFPLQVAADLVPPMQPANVTVTGYKLLLNGTVIQTIPVASCPGPAKCTVSFAVAAVGTYALAYQTASVLLDVDPTSEVDSAPSPSTTFKVQQAGTAPTQAPAVHKAGS